VNGNGTFDSGTDRSFFLGWAGATIVTATGTGMAERKSGCTATGIWFLDYDGNGVWDGGVKDKLVAWGWTGATPIVGDWNGDGKTKIGVYSNASGFSTTTATIYGMAGWWTSRWVGAGRELCRLWGTGTATEERRSGCISMVLVPGLRWQLLMGWRRCGQASWLGLGRGDADCGDWERGRKDQDRGVRRRILVPRLRWQLPVGIPGQG